MSRNGLILSRELDEQIVVRVPPSNAVQEVVVTLAYLRGNCAGIGCKAGPNVTINRREVQDEIDRGAPQRRKP